MTLAPPTGSLGGRRRWLAWGLFASLVVNAFFIGLAATDLFRPKHVGGPLRFEMRWLEGSLPAADLARVQAAVASVGPALQARIDRMKAMRRELGALVAVPQPDRAAIDAKLSEIRTELTAMTAEGQATVADALLALPAESRAKLANASVDR